MSDKGQTSHSAPSVLAPGEGKSIAGAGVKVVFKTTGADTDTRWTLMEYTAPPHFSGPAPHWHKITQEAFYVLEGTLTCQVGEQTAEVGPGGYVYIPTGVVHAFSNSTDEPARFLTFIAPAGMEHYLEELAEMVKEEPTWPPADMRKVMALMSKYDTYPPEAQPE